MHGVLEAGCSEVTLCIAVSPCLSRINGSTLDVATSSTIPGAADSTLTAQ